MATTKKTQNRTNKSGKSTSSKKSTRKNKSSSDDTMKFLLVLIIAGIAIALIFFSQSGDGEKTGNMVTGTPTPTMEAEATRAPEPTATPKPTKAETEPTPVQEPTPTKAPEPDAAATATPEPTATPVPTNTPTPTPALSASEAELVVNAVVDTVVYSVQLVNENLQVGNGCYYQFGAIAGKEFVYPFLVVNKLDGTLHYYDSTEDTVFDFTKFPLQIEVTPTPTPAVVSQLTVEEAYNILCTYSKEALQIAKEVKEYDAEYGSELTLINGVDCYRINLSEFSNGKVRNRGEFYISIDGTKCFYIDSNTSEFIEAKK